MSIKPIRLIHPRYHDLIAFHRRSHAPISVSRRVSCRSNITLLRPSKQLSEKHFAPREIALSAMNWAADKSQLPDCKVSLPLSSLSIQSTASFVKSAQAPAVIDWISLVMVETKQKVAKETELETLKFIDIRRRKSLQKFSAMKATQHSKSDYPLSYTRHIHHRTRRKVSQDALYQTTGYSPNNRSHILVRARISRDPRYVQYQPFIKFPWLW